ncbi:GNAT family N-acetyltransferase [Haloarcula litorea]|uniref:GNAT family N-acetyltransferase n=1 Tax=Haloarcula litorea TaxID=3032579 RepID=UPI0023E8D5BC|nr:GNAT family N-acetyltransferase [Halomicroarcula sp. GDY20]
MTSPEWFVGDDPALVDRAKTVRRAVFIEEQGVSEAEEMDGKDTDATHVLGAVDGSPVATTRLRFVDDATVKVERVAVLDDYRGEGLGQGVMRVAERVAADAGAVEAQLHAQTHVRGFYEQLGYEAHGEEFEEAGIPHVAMEKRLG